MNKLSNREKLIGFSKLKDQNFEEGMYPFMMFMMNYFTRVKEDLKLDYDSFMIIQLVVTHVIYQSKKRLKDKKSFLQMESLWEKVINKYKEENILNVIKKSSIEVKNFKNNKLTISSICLALNLPKETVRRKIVKLSKKKILATNEKLGISIGEGYKKIFSNFVPTTVMQFSKLLRTLEQKDVLKSLLQFKTL